MIPGVNVNMFAFRQSRYRLVLLPVMIFTIFTFVWFRYFDHERLRWLHGATVAAPPIISDEVPMPALSESQSTSTVDVEHKPLPSETYKVPSTATFEPLQSMLAESKIFLKNTVSSGQFRELGDRIQKVRSWMELAESWSDEIGEDQMDIAKDNISATLLSLFPFLKNPSNPQDPRPFESLQKSYSKGSKGIVIPTGKKNFRFSCHLIKNIRQALRSELPIQIAYAGDEDLPSTYREFVKSIDTQIDTMDVTQFLDDTTLKLTEGGWAIKPFAALVSPFEQVILLDADAVFIQSPDVIFDGHPGYKESGTLLFHDRLLWQGAFAERHAWWEKELKDHEPSPALQKSRVYNDGYAEECDSGLVAIDKRRLKTLLGLLHVCWQNSAEVRDQWTYKQGYGDKESWWFGLELSGAHYTFEDHYASIVGSAWSVGDVKRVCGFTIAHLDAQDKLLWYNGSLLKNKAINQTAFDVPIHWAMDGEWEKGGQKKDESCIRASTAMNMTDEEVRVIQSTVDAAQDVDIKIKESTLVDGEF